MDDNVPPVAETVPIVQDQVPASVPDAATVAAPVGDAISAGLILRMDGYEGVQKRVDERFAKNEELIASALLERNQLLDLNNSLQGDVFKNSYNLEMANRKVKAFNVRIMGVPKRFNNPQARMPYADRQNGLREFAEKVFAMMGMTPELIARSKSDISEHYSLGASGLLLAFTHKSTAQALLSRRGQKIGKNEDGGDVVCYADETQIEQEQRRKAGELKAALTPFVDKENRILVRADGHIKIGPKLVSLTDAYKLLYGYQHAAGGTGDTEDATVEREGGGGGGEEGAGGPGGVGKKRRLKRARRDPSPDTIRLASYAKRSRTNPDPLTSSNTAQNFTNRKRTFGAISEIPALE